MPKNDTHEPEPARQDADGNVYLAYYVPERQAGFCWSGDYTQPVEVAYGGMGEPVEDRFHMTPHLTDPSGFLAAYKRACDEFLTTKEN